MSLANCKSIQVIWLLVVIVAGYFVYNLEDQITIYKENGLLENLQAGILLLTCFYMVIVGRNLQGSSRYAAWMFAWICLAFFFREFDVRKTDWPEFAHMIFGKPGQYIWFLPLMFILVQIFRNIRFYLRNILLYLLSPMMLTIILGGILIVMGAVFDKQIIPTENKFWEEYLEVAAYAYLFLAAMLSPTSFRYIETQAK
ncbi:hypothetical protein [Amphritea balenae]|uniref:Uncharacterized protein n=1 Tax=Amphritea balenae TaxID=452629 RepID=A0A3P1SPC0_9GAMM|nr:hypothetical protein [Amphritea balenae]RRC98869.1 hypothetical protein EHS89_11815 [Amphritea balenae]GGK62426.1 hypothetical protein GCM10007941_10690 [Amphritea balenae]